MKTTHSMPRAGAGQAGFTLLEALITIVIMAFGLIGLAGLQAKIQLSESESFQRAQAMLLVEDMANRLSANRKNAAGYVTGTAVGTGDSLPAACGALSGAQRDLCEWSQELKGAGEKQAGSAASIGAMTGARGCIELVGSNPPVYRVTVAWQGLSEFKAPSLTCGEGLYGADGYRRAIASLVPVSCLTC